MFVRNMMIPKDRCHVVTGKDSLTSVLEKLDQAKVDGFPVLDGNNYIGIITRFCIYESYFYTNMPKELFLKTKKAKDVAIRHETVLQENEVFERTLIRFQYLPLLAVMDENKKFLGIVTRSDVMEEFQSVFGTRRSGIRIAFTALEVEGRITRLAAIIQKFHESVISLVTFDETDTLMRRIVLKIEQTKNLKPFITELERNGFRILAIDKV